jgi:hypothetical protein
VTTSTAGAIVLEVSCFNVAGDCGANAGVWGGGASNASTGFAFGFGCGPCPASCSTGCVGAGNFKFRLRSVNGFTGNVTVGCGSSGCSSECVGIPGTYYLTAGGTVSLGSYPYVSVGVVGSGNVHGVGQYYATALVTVSGSAAGAGGAACIASGSVIVPHC